MRPKMQTCLFINKMIPSPKLRLFVLKTSKEKLGFPVGSVIMNPPANAGDAD